MAAAPHVTSLGELAHGAIAKYLKHTVAYEKPVLDDSDPEDLHQMRVGLRRLRTAVQVFAGGLELPKAAREPSIAAVGRQLGQLRDLDVIGMNVRDRYSPDLPDHEQESLGVVLFNLGQQRQKTFKQVKKLLKGKAYSQLKQSLADWLAEPTYKAIAILPADQVVPDLVLPLISQLWVHPGWLVGTKPGRANPTQAGLQVNTRLNLAATDALIADQGTVLHSLRKQVKRVRYQLRIVADLYPGRLADDLQRFSQLQDILGELQDSTVLEQFIESTVPGARDQMPRLFALLADSRHRAWKQWQSHQRHYLAAAQRQRLRLALLYPGEQAGEADASEAKGLR